MFDGLNANGRCDMSFASSWAADQHDVLRPLHKLAAMQGPKRGLVDLAGGEVEAREILVCREAWPDFM